MSTLPPLNFIFFYHQIVPRQEEGGGNDRGWRPVLITLGITCPLQVVAYPRVSGFYPPRYIQMPTFFVLKNFWIIRFNARHDSNLSHDNGHCNNKAFYDYGHVDGVKVQLLRIKV